MPQIAMRDIERYDDCRLSIWESAKKIAERFGRKPASCANQVFMYRSGFSSGKIYHNFRKSLTSPSEFRKLNDKSIITTINFLEKEEEQEKSQLEYALNEAIQSLSPMQQKVIYEIFYNNSYPAKIARKRGISKQAIQSYRDEALKKIRNRLSPLMEKLSA